MNNQINATKKVCPYCSSNEIMKAGWTYRLTGKRQRWLCKKCYHTFDEITIQKKVNA